jgi:pilus assembly protein CpaC
MPATARTMSSAIGSALLALSLVSAGASGANAQQAAPRPQTETSASGTARTINLGVGRSLILDLPRDAAEIFVGDPKVVNAVVRSARKVYIIAASLGQTSIYALDAQGAQISEFQISVQRDLAQLQEAIRAALPKSNITVRMTQIPSATGVGAGLATVILGGTADSAGEAQTAQDIAAAFVSSDSGKIVNTITLRARDQVMLKVTIAEVQRSIVKQLGIQDMLARGSWGSWSVNNPFSVNSSPVTAGALQLGNFGSMAGNAAIHGLSAQIQAYERNGVAKILAEPTVTAASGELAKFTVGGEIPVPQSETCTGAVCTIGVTFKPYGVGLNFTPVVLGEGRILLHVATEVTEIDPSNAVKFNTISVPGFRTRKNDTSVEIPTGGSMVTAGLIQSVSKQAISGLPGLMNLPVLGALFRSRDYQRQETELMIIVTPYIAKSVNPQEIARPTDGLFDPTDPQGAMLGRVNRLYATTDNPQVIKNFKGKVGFIAD